MERGRAFDLTALIDPLRAEDFFAEHWERRPLHRRRGDEGYYASLLTTADLERLISSADLRYPAIQLARHGGYFPPEVYTKSVKHGTEVWSGVPDVEKIRSEYRSGATVVLPALHRTWAPLRELCAGLERHLSHAVHANAYLTAGDTTRVPPPLRHARGVRPPDRRQEALARRRAAGGAAAPQPALRAPWPPRWRRRCSRSSSTRAICSISRAATCTAPPPRTASPPTSPSESRCTPGSSCSPSWPSRAGA